MMLLTSLLLLSSTAAKSTVYLIRHGEKPMTGDGLSAQGLQRAQCLRQVFSGESQYQIDYIMAQKPKKGGF
jgi:broad specificity phosphatase PhoE